MVELRLIIACTLIGICGVFFTCSYNMTEPIPIDIDEIVVGSGWESNRPKLCNDTASTEIIFTAKDTISNVIDGVIYFTEEGVLDSFIRDGVFIKDPFMAAAIAMNLDTNLVCSSSSFSSGFLGVDGHIGTMEPWIYNNGDDNGYIYILAYRDGILIPKGFQLNSFEN